MSILSSFLTSRPTTISRRWDKTKKVYIDVPLPNIVSKNNKNMGGVDLHDQHMSYYMMRFKCKKYYIRLIFHLIDMAVVNSWKLLRRTENIMKIEYSKQTSLREFKLKQSDSLLMSNKDIMKKKGHPSENSLEREFVKKKKMGNATKSIPEQDIRKDGVRHWPSFHGANSTHKHDGHEPVDLYH